MAKVGLKGGEKMKEALEGIRRRVENAKAVNTGFLSGATYPDGTPVAMVAAIQNYGAPAAGIPPRPFFTRMVQDKSPGWGISLGNQLKNTNYDAHKALALMGEGISGQLQAAIREFKDPPLKPATVKAKGFAKPLIDTSHMLNSTGYEVKE